jgi:hypothetical protein
VSPTTRVRVLVIDSARAKVSAAEVSVVQGVNTVLASGLTDDAGARTLTLKREQTVQDYQLVVRKVGYKRTERFFWLAPGDTISLTVVLARAVPQLDTVKVAATEDRRRRNYFIDAEAIAGTSRPIFSALDVIEKLRPYMVAGFAGWRVCHPLENVWVNGERIVFAPIDEMLRASGRTGITARIDLQTRSILRSIRPEHIAEMRYDDCFQRGNHFLHGENAVFIVLKPGIAFAPGQGTYVVESPPPPRRP